MKLKKLFSAATAAVLVGTSCCLSPVSAVTTQESDLPCTIYAESVTAQPGQEGVGISVYIRDNPGYIASGIRIVYDEADAILTPHLDETGEYAYTVGEAADELIPKFAVNIEKKMAGLSTLKAGRPETDNGLMFTAYFDVAADAEPGSYPVKIEVVNLEILEEGSGSKDVPYQLETEYYAVNVVNDSPAVTTSAPVTTTTEAVTTTTTAAAGDAAKDDGIGFYGDAVIVKPGDTKVAYSVNVRNNTGFSPCGLRLIYPEGLVPVLDEKGHLKTEIGEAGKDLETVSFALSEETHMIGMVAMSVEESKTDGVLFTCYFDVPADMKAGTYPVTIEVKKLASASGKLLTSSVENGSITVKGTPSVKLGDVSEDDKIDVGDAVLLARFLAEDEEAVVTPNGKLNADVNKNGSPDPEDITLILRYIARLITKF